jgi:hypothetical protein
MDTQSLGDLIANADMPGLAGRSLDHDLTPEKLDALVVIQESLHAVRETLVEALGSGRIATKDYLIQLHSAIMRAHDDINMILGYEDMQSMFGDDPSEGLIPKASNDNPQQK